MAQIRQLGTALSGSTTGTDDREQHQGEGTPEGVVTGDIGDLYRDITPSAAVIYLKTVGNNVATGWEAVATEVPVSVEAADVTFDATGLDFFTEADVQAALAEADPVLAALIAAGTTFTQTYSTADTTVAAATAGAVATTAATSTLPFGYAEAQANAIPVAINALIADNLNLRQLVNALIDALQAAGVVA